MELLEIATYSDRARLVSRPGHKQSILNHYHDASFVHTLKKKNRDNQRFLRSKAVLVISQIDILFVTFFPF